MFQEFPEQPSILDDPIVKWMRNWVAMPWRLQGVSFGHEKYILSTSDSGRFVRGVKHQLHTESCLLGSKPIRPELPVAFVGQLKEVEPGNETKTKFKGKPLASQCKLWICNLQLCGY